jgi:hypothetical protein
MKYEYHVLHVNDDWFNESKSGNGTSKLNVLGGGGWELIEALTLSDLTHVLIFRRADDRTR